MESLQSSKVCTLIISLRRGSLLAVSTIWLVICAPMSLAEDTGVLDLTKQAPMDRDVRLVGGRQLLEGRIEIYIQSSGQWHTHCNTPRREEFYHVVCRTLGFGAFVKDLDVKDFEKSTRVPLQGHFECNKDSNSLRDCFFKQGDGCGSNEEEAGIVCSGVVPSCGPITFQKGDYREMHPFKLSYPVDTRVNVKCPGDPSISGVMKCVNGHWEWEGKEPPACPPRVDDSTSCPAPFIDTRQTFLHPWKLAYLYHETLDIVCVDRSNRTSLRCGDGGRLECINEGEDCVPKAPSCLTPTSTHIDEKLILVGGDKPNKGRVLVNRDGQWGSICADGWNLESANVICSQLGFGPARELVKTPQCPPGPKEYFFREVRCTAGDTNILGCSLKHMSPGDKCQSGHEVEVDCFPEEQLFLNAEHQLSSLRSNCGPPGLPPNTLAKPFKHVYESGEKVTLSCAGKRSNKVELTCASDGLWRGDVIDCGKFPQTGMKWVIAISVGIASLSVVINFTMICCCSRRRVPTGEEKDAPPANEEPKPQPISQQPVLPQPRPRSDDNKLE